MSRTLKLTFATQAEDKRIINVPNPKANLDAAAAGAAMTQIVTNGAAFADPVTSGLRAEIIERNVTVLVNNE